jgi:hypothetical protein
MNLQDIDMKCAYKSIYLNGAQTILMLWVTDT